MTKEELEKEAEELYEDWYAHKLGAISIIGVICKMAEPREKRIAELEEKVNGVEFINKQLNEQLIQKSDTNHQLVEQIAKLNERCSELEAENKQIKNSDTLCKLIGEQKIKIKELEAQIEKMKVCCNCDWSNYLPNGNCLNCDGKKNWKLKEIKEK